MESHEELTTTVQPITKIIAKINNFTRNKRDLSLFGKREIKITSRTAIITKVCAGLQRFEIKSIIIYIFIYII